MNTEITNAVVASDDKAQYDEKVKRLLEERPTPWLGVQSRAF